MAEKACVHACVAVHVCVRRSVSAQGACTEYSRWTMRTNPPRAVAHLFFPHSFSPLSLLLQLWITDQGNPESLLETQKVHL